jgi:small subunit ribosomal protein S14
MARKSIIAKAAKTPKFTTRIRRRCEECGRGNSVYRLYGMNLCRMHVRNYFQNGWAPGYRKAS